MGPKTRRIARLGATHKHIIVSNLVMQDTIDEAILKLTLKSEMWLIHLLQIRRKKRSILESYWKKLRDLENKVLMKGLKNVDATKYKIGDRISVKGNKEIFNNWEIIHRKDDGDFIVQNVNNNRFLVVAPSDIEDLIP